MDADWLYASYHYSHPILPERLGALGWKVEESDKKKDSEKPVTAKDREL
jgi:STE24 endopeptidase